MRQSVIAHSGRHRAGAAAERPLLRLSRAAATGVLAGAITGLVLLLISSLLLLRGKDPGSVAAPVGATVLLLSSLVAGLTAGKLYGGARLFPVAPLEAALWSLFVYLLSFIGKGGVGGFTSAVYVTALRLASACAVVLGTHFSVHRPQGDVRARRGRERRR